MTLAAIRAIFELGMDNAYNVPVIYDNVEETPPASYPYVYVNLTYSQMSRSVICMTENAVEAINGNVQVSVYQKRGVGMRQLEQLCADGMTALNDLYDWSAAVKVKVGSIQGPQTVLTGPEPYVVATFSAPFLAHVR